MTNPCNSCELQGFFVYDIPRSDAVSRDTRSCHFALRRGIQKYRQRLVPASDTLLDPALSAGYVHSSQQREERTKKRRRCYRALSVVGWRRPRGLRNSLRSDSPRPRSSVGWPLPGPIKAESIATMQRLGHTARGGESMSYRAPGIPVHVLPRCDAVSREYTHRIVFAFNSCGYKNNEYSCILTCLSLTLHQFHSGRTYLE